MAHIERHGVTKCPAAAVLPTTTKNLRGERIADPEYERRSKHAIRVLKKIPIWKRGAGRKKIEAT